MLEKSQMQEIQDLKLRGYTKAEILAYYKDQGVKPPSRPTISKYYDMDVVPHNPGEKLSKEKAFDVSPFREAIIAIFLDNSRGDFCISSVYDVLEEKFIENGDYESLPGNEQTLRNYVQRIRYASRRADAHRFWRSHAHQKNIDSFHLPPASLFKAPVRLCSGS